MTEASRLAQAQLDAYNAHDIDAFVSCYHPLVQVYDLHSGTVTMQGHAAMRERYGELFRTKPNLHATLVQRIVLNNTAVDHEHVVGLIDDTVVQAIATYQIEDGAIRRVWFAK